MSLSKGDHESNNRACTNIDTHDMKKVEKRNAAVGDGGSVGSGIDSGGGRSGGDCRGGSDRAVAKKCTEGLVSVKKSARPLRSKVKMDQRKISTPVSTSNPSLAAGPTRETHSSAHSTDSLAHLTNSSAHSKTSSALPAHATHSDSQTTKPKSSVSLESQKASRNSMKDDKMTTMEALLTFK